jgi:hypothetical protein
MVMGDKGMHDMAGMEIPLPDNTLPMMTGEGPFGPIGMGGMFSVVKVRDDVARGDFKDPGPYRHPAGTLASEYTADVPEPVRAADAKTGPARLDVRKPAGHEHH